MEGFVFYRLPNEKSIQGYEGVWRLIDPRTKLKRSFVVSDFKKSQRFCLDMTKKNKINFSLDFIGGIELRTLESHFSEVSKHDYIDLIINGKEFCKKHNGKVVLSRKKRYEVAITPEMIFHIFETMCDEYVATFNSLLYIPGRGLWIGASPEKLIASHKDSFHISSLAGSKNNHMDYEWTSKEFEEQEIVTQEVQKTLESSNIDYQKGPIETVKAGSLDHLHTLFTISQEYDVIKLVQSLHPTPAICGLPRKEAMDFIDANEGYERSFYSGYLGVLGDEETNLYVNLRCGQLYNNSIIAYVGGGITRESVPEDEWEETELKSTTLLSLIEKM